MRRALLIAVVVAVPAAARAEGMGARLGAVVGGRVNGGTFGDHYRVAWELGVSSAVDWRSDDGVWRGGLAWWLGAAQNLSSTDHNVDDTISLWHVGLGLHGGARLPIRSQPHLVLAFGPELVRANAPVPPGEEESFWGLAGEVGLDWAMLGNMYLRTGVAGAYTFDGPTNLGVLVSIGYWGR